MTTKVTRNMLNTSIVDNGNATAITIDSSEDVTVNNGTLTSSGANGVGNQGFHITDTGYSKTHKLFGDNSLHIQADSGQSILMKPNASEIARFTSDGLTFNGDTAAANALDDYEVGTYTPVMNSSNLTYTYQTGWYVKIGSHVTVGIHIDINTNGNGSGVAIGDISLPFAPSLGGSTYYAMTSTIWCNGWSTATKSDVGLVSHDYSYIVTRKAAGQGNVATPTHGDLGGGNMLMTVSYKTA